MPQVGEIVLSEGQPGRILKISVGRYKSIKDLQVFCVEPVNVLIGANGAGKSNFISLFRMLSAVSQRRLQDYVARSGGANSILFYGSKVSPMMWISVECRGKFNDDAVYFAQLSPTADDSLYFSPETVHLKETRSSSRQPENLGSGHKETRIDPDRHAEVWRCLGDIQILHLSDTSATAAIRRRGYIEDNHRLNEDGGNLAAFLYAIQLRQPAYYRRIVDTIRLIAPFFDDFDLRPLTLDPNQISLNWRDRDSRQLLGPHQLSDGTLRAMALVAFLAQQEQTLPGLMILDEPEIGLHPHALEIIAGLVQAASLHCPVILATQSAPLLNFFTASQIVTVDREGDHTIFRRVNGSDLDTWLEDYTMGELWEKNLISVQLPP